jgi:diphthine-ammonia ligase
LAARAWRAAHNASPSGEEDQEDDDDDEGPDVWDRRYNDRFRSYAAAPSGGDKKGLPDRSVLTPSSAAAVPAPPLFVAEVAELPRAAGVEWHAHLGIAHAGEGSVALRTVEREGGVVVTQVVVVAAGGAAASFVQTVVAEPLAAGGGGQGGEGHGRIAAAALAELGEVGDAGGAEGEPAAAVRYVDAGVLRQSQGQAKGEGVGGGLVVPCRSLWDDEGRRLAAVTVYQSVFERRG